MSDITAAAVIHHSKGHRVISIGNETTGVNLDLVIADTADKADTVISASVHGPNIGATADDTVGISEIILHFAEMLNQ